MDLKNKEEKIFVSSIDQIKVWCTPMKVKSRTVIHLLMAVKFIEINTISNYVHVFVLIESETKENSINNSCNFHYYFVFFFVKVMECTCVCFLTPSPMNFHPNSYHQANNVQYVETKMFTLRPSEMKSVSVSFYISIFLAQLNQPLA